jgi:hypothetical protein
MNMKRDEHTLTHDHPGNQVKGLGNSEDADRHSEIRHPHSLKL